MTILVTGGTGMVGRSLEKILPDAVYAGSRYCDLTDRNAVREMLDVLRPETVIHLAARVGGIMDNIHYPAEYYDQNIMMNTNVLAASREAGVRRFIGVLSTCIYPDVSPTYPMTMDMIHMGPPAKTNFSYGYAKRALAVQIDAYNAQYGLSYQYLIPCNLYGPNDRFDESSHFVSVLIKKIHDAKVRGNKEITLLGDGTPLRQFMHSDDFAAVIKACIDNGVTSHMNVATPENLSIREITDIALRAMDATDIRYKFMDVHLNGQHRKDVETGAVWSTFPDLSPRSLEEGIRQTYNAVQDKL